MRIHALARLSDRTLLRRLARLVAHDRATTAGLVASIAEVDARKLYAPAGYSSMHAYCVEELRLSEDAAARRIQAARASRRVPALFVALAEGKLHLTAVCLLAPHLTLENAEDLIAAATGRSKAEIEMMLVRRYLPATGLQHALAHVEAAGEARAAGSGEHAPGTGEDATTGAASANDEHALAHVAASLADAGSLSQELVSIRLVVPRSTREKLRYAQALLSHAVPSGDPAVVLDRALDALIRQLERRKFGGGNRPALESRPAPENRSAPAAPQPRRIPAGIRRAVWERDGGRCTFVGASGHRCGSERFLEFDHVEPVARGGPATVEGLRLRCRTHNQYEAERVFGAEFMNRKRDEARRARAHAAPRAGQAREAEAADAGARAETEAHRRDITACLRRLGCRAEEARRVAESAISLPARTFEERLREALRSLRPV